MHRISFAPFPSFHLPCRIMIGNPRLAAIMPPAPEILYGFVFLQCYQDFAFLHSIPPMSGPSALINCSAQITRITKTTIPIPGAQSVTSIIIPHFPSKCPIISRTSGPPLLKAFVNRPPRFQRLEFNQQSVSCLIQYRRPVSRLHPIKSDIHFGPCCSAHTGLPVVVAG